MNYIWEVMLRAENEGMDPSGIRFLPVSNGSPYTEVVFEDINRKSLSGKTVEVNPLYRFAKVFSKVFDFNVTGYEKTRDIFFDAMMHYMAELDLREGLSKQEYFLRFLIRDLMNGVCGSQAQEVIMRFDKKKMRRLLYLILKLYQCGSSVYLFKEVMRCMYPESLVYASNEAVRQILIYIGQKETENERLKLNFLQDMFLPINFQVILFWEHHFGIFDVEETMVMGELMLF